MNFLAVLRRAFTSNLGTIAVNDEERAKLETTGVQEPTAQRYVVWRRATVLMVVIATLISAGVSTYQTATESDDEPNLFDTMTENLLQQLQGAVPSPANLADGSAAKEDEKDEGEEAQATMGRIVDGVHLASLYVMPIAALVVLFLGDRMRLSFRVMLAAFAFSFFVPMLVELCPWSWWGVVEPKYSPTAEPAKFARDQLEGILEGAGNLVRLMPAVLSLIPGIVRACLRVKSLLPESLLPGWLVVVAAPLYALFLFVAFVAIDQVNSDPLIFAGFLLLAASSLVYVFRSKVFTRPLISDADFRAMRGAQMIVTGMTALGGVLILTYLLTRQIMGVHLVGTDPETSLLQPIQLVGYLVEIISRSMFVTALGADLFMRMNLTAWQHHRALGTSNRAPAYDGAMQALERVV
jgi:hypothetical protein